MLERLEVHGKVYEPLAVVAGVVSYSEEELTQLVQAKLIPAAMIDNEWFVDKLAAVQLQHTTPSDIQKRKHAAHKLKRADAIKTVYATNADTKTVQPMLVTLQASAVLACGLLVGSLLFWSDQANIDLVALEAGVFKASEAFLEGLAPVWSTWQDLGNTYIYDK